MKDLKERGHRAQRLASTKMLAGAPQGAAASDPKSDSFSTHPQSREGWVEKLVQNRAQNQNSPALTRELDTKLVTATKTRGVGQM
ncbi:MAG TPA: hypothetical protein VGI32_17645 [Steroidobacteraceae bacterium]|jgi:hypothetical protein